MEFIQAEMKDIDIVTNIAVETIKSVFPKYYPEGIVTTFEKQSNEAALSRDIKAGFLYLAKVDDKYIGLGSLNRNRITRIFVLPEYAGLSYGSQIMDNLEQLIAINYDRVLVDATLASQSLFLHRGYVMTSYQRVITGSAGSVYCYYEMEKTFSKHVCRNINYNNRVFTTVQNSDKGDRINGTVVRYYQDENMIWADYTSDYILLGFIIGKVDGEGNIKGTYKHVKNDGTIRTGVYKARPEVLSDDKIRLHEYWRLTNGEGEGESIVEEFDIGI